MWPGAFHLQTHLIPTYPSVGVRAEGQCGFPANQIKFQGPLVSGVQCNDLISVYIANVSVRHLT